MNAYEVSLVCKEAEDSSLLGLYGTTTGRDGGREGEGVECSLNYKDPEPYDDETAQTKEQYLQVSFTLYHTILY